MIIGIASFMFAALVVIVSPFVFGESLPCLEFNDGKVAVIRIFDPLRECNWHPTYSWFLSKGYHVDKWLNEGIRNELIEVYMSR